MNPSQWKTGRFSLWPSLNVPIPRWPLLARNHITNKLQTAYRDCSSTIRKVVWNGVFMSSISRSCGEEITYNAKFSRLVFCSRWVWHTLGCKKPQVTEKCGIKISEETSLSIPVSFPCTSFGRIIPTCWIPYTISVNHSKLGLDLSPTKSLSSLAGSNFGDNHEAWWWKIKFSV